MDFENWFYNSFNFGLRQIRDLQRSGFNPSPKEYGQALLSKGRRKKKKRK